jgi:hypothetical protein
MSHAYSDDGDLLGGRAEIERWLDTCRAPAPPSDFRDRVLASMEVAAEERREMLADHGRLAALSRRRHRMVPEVVAGIVAALVVMLVPWMGSAGSGRPDRPADAVAVPVAAMRADEPPDVHHALELLDARRDLFAAVQAAGRSPLTF